MAQAVSSDANDVRIAADLVSLLLSPPPSPSEEVASTESARRSPSASSTSAPSTAPSFFPRKMDHPSAPLSYNLLKEITNDFSEERKIGSGSYGRVYKGVHKDGKTIAVKLLYDMPGLDDEQFKREFNNLKILQHDNIVRLVGCCHEIEQEWVEYNGSMVLADKIHRALCFEYAHNGSLHENLFDEFNGHDWHTRYGIIKGICSGLKYLHQELKPPMYHLDIKPANVLLDENMLPRVADFGLSRLFGEEQTRITTSSLGTLGYLPPEYIEQNVISNKFDIFSLGVVILKVMAGPEGHSRCADLSSQEFVELVLKNWRARLEAPPIREPGPEAYCVQVKTCIEIALKCVQANRRRRPSINDIIDKMNQTENTIRLWLPLDAYLKKPYFASDISGLTRFEYNDLAVMTDGFSNHLGFGAFGMVYKGSYKDLNGYQEVAVKEIKKTTEGEVHDFIAELRRIGRMRHTHTNLIELKGWCCSRNTWNLVDFICCCRQQRVKFFLVFEFVPNANLEDHLHDRKKILPWQKRYQIIKGIGSALRHLHHECNRTILHGDIKPSSVLLDFDFNAKLGGFGLSRTASKNNTTLVTTAIGTEGYMDPCKSDIYSFGILLLEIACTGKSREQVWKLYREEPDVMEYAADRRLGGIFDKSQMKRVIVLGLRCSHPDGKHRPFMADAMRFLEDGIELPAILEIEEQQGSRFLGIESAEMQIVGDLEMIVNDSLIVDAGRGGSSSWLSGGRGGIESARSLHQEVVQEVVAHGTQEFTLSEIMAATNNFSLENVIGDGNFGKVYRGTLHDGREVAVKRGKHSRLELEQNRSELDILSPLRHKNIIRLVGCCVTKEYKCRITWRRKEPQTEERMIVYEYMENRTLYEHLHPHQGSSSLSPVTVSWKVRIDVLLGVSRAIEHLHCHANPPIIHRDIKSVNIHLDASWVPRLSDFGLSLEYLHIANEDLGLEVDAIAGTLGYLDPEYANSGYVKPSSDVYGLGVVMLEVLTGKPAYSWPEDENEIHTSFPSWPLPIIDADNLGELLDRRPVPEPTPGQLRALEQVAQMAARCVGMNGKDRPAISDIVGSLEMALELIFQDETCSS